jgi:hypothetical protein
VEVSVTNPSGHFSIRLSTGETLKLPVNIKSAVSYAAAVPRKMRRYTFHCPNGHFMGIATDTQPALIIRSGDRYPSYALADEGGFHGVMTGDNGEGLLLPTTDRIRIICRTCDYLECWLTADDIADHPPGAVSLVPAPSAH